MAHSMSSQQGQFPKVCGLCEADIKISWKCLKCDILMCNKCKEIHRKIKSVDKHKIIDIMEVGKHSEEPDFGNINCEDHDQLTCVMFCKSCDQLVCPQCMAEVHNGHRFVQISEGYKIKIKNAKEIQIKIKSQLEEITTEEKKIKLLREDKNSKYLETRNHMHAQNAALKREVDKYTEKLIKELDQKWETLQNSMAAEERKVTNLKNKKGDQNTKVNNIINANDAVQVFKESKQIGIFVKKTMEPVKLDFTIMPKFIPGQINPDNFGSLQNVPNDLVLNIHQRFTTDIRFVGFVSTSSNNSLWIGDQNVIQRVKPEGSNLKVMSNFNIMNYGTAVTPSSDLLLVTHTSRLQQISDSSGQIRDSVYSVDPLLITAVHVTSDYKVILGASDSDRAVVIRMNKEGKHEKTYEHDRNKQPIFTNVFRITITTNGTIFVVDKLSDDLRRVLALGQEGDVINTYNGHPKINSDNNPFKPINVMRTPLDNIIVTTLNNNYLYILNIVGHLITYYDTNNIGIVRPYSLSFTRSGQLYIGGKTAGQTNKAMLYKVDISEI